MARTDQELAQLEANRRGLNTSSALGYLDRQAGKFNAGMIDATLGLHDLAVTGLSSLGNYIFGRNDQPYLLADRAKSAINAETDASSPLYMAGAASSRYCGLCSGSDNTRRISFAGRSWLRSKRGSQHLLVARRALRSVANMEILASLLVAFWEDR